MMAKKLEVDQGIVFLETLVSLSDDDITLTSKMQMRPGGLVGTRTLNKEDLISNLLVKFLKFAVSTFENDVMLPQVL